MGTNYYLRRDVCHHCKRGADELHIGKSSVGWCFSLNTHPYEGIISLNDWIFAWSQPDAYIFDEYGEEVTPKDMLATITERAWVGRELRRHAVDGRFCIANGDGTYDLMRGEFM